MAQKSKPDLTVEAGFTSVDDQPDTDFVVGTMDATAQWPAIRQLRAWERERLHLRPGDHVLDVGCGVGLGLVTNELAAAFVDEFYDSARRARFFMSLTMVAVAGRRPDA